MVQININNLLSSYDFKDLTIATVCSHSSLQLFHGAKKEGFKTLGIAVGESRRIFYDAFPLAKPDEFLMVDNYKDILSHTNELKEKNVIVIPHGSFVEYLGAETFLTLDLPTFGNRQVLNWESDRNQERIWLEGAGLIMPKEIKDPHFIESPVIVKYHGAKGGKGFFIAKSYEEFKRRIDETKTDESEKKVYTDSKRIINKEKNVSIVDFNFKDLDRFHTFYQIAKNLDKQLVINFKHACFLERYHKDPFVEAPNSTDESISLLLPKRHTGTYNKEDYSEAYVKKRLDYPNIIQAEEIIKNPRKYMVVLNFWYFNMLIDLKPYHGTYIHSLSEPFNEEMELSYDRMKNWLNHFDLSLNQSHCSGHINGTDLKQVIRKIKPKTLFPVHTEKPESFTSFHDNTVRVIQGKRYHI